MPECGTYAAHQAHKRRGEPIDQDCRRAGAAYQRQRRAAAGEAEQQARRQHRRAYERALARLRDQHRGEFAAILHCELTAVRADGRLAEAAAAGPGDSWWEAHDA